MIEVRGSDTDLSTFLIKLRHMGTQVSDPISADNGVEMHDMSSLKSGEELNNSDHLI